MGKFVKIATQREVPEGTGLTIEVEGQGIALFNVEGVFYAIDNRCKHRGGPLGEGSLEGKEVICPWHGWQYDVTTGQCTTDPAVLQTRYNLKVEGDDIFAELPE